MITEVVPQVEAKTGPSPRKVLVMGAAVDLRHLLMMAVDNRDDRGGAEHDYSYEKHSKLSHLLFPLS
jgi:hypothetical protein